LVELTGALAPREETKEKDRFAPAPMADQPLHAGESLGESLFPREVEAEFAHVAE
jgi:hypothetical protein